MKYAIILLLFTGVILCLSMGAGDKKKDITPAIHSIADLSRQRIVQLDSFLEQYPKYFYDSSFAVRQQKYEEFAYYFKRAASFIIYFESDIYYKKLIGSFKFQKNKWPGLLGVVPDNWIFTGPIGNEHDTLLIKYYKKQDSLNQADFITTITGKYRTALSETNYANHLSSMSESVLFDALRIEIFRISSIDIANGDFIVEDAGIPSLNGSMESWMLFTSQLVALAPGSVSRQWESLTATTKDYLAKNKAFKTFDRMYFIRHHLIPLSRFLNELQLSLKVPYLKKSRAFQNNAGHLYENDFFIPDYFAPNEQARYSKLKATLGELLFFDPMLSGNNKRACASCHNPQMAFTDGKIKSVGFEFEEVLGRNSPTVINSGFQTKLFWDQRAGSLEDQLDSVVNNKSELHGSFDELCERINSSPEYVAIFHKAFPHTKKKGITRDDIKNAIGVYERTVTGLNSRFDQYMQGDVSKLSRDEINGFNLFMGKARCGNCHFAPLFNGALPPFFDITDHHSLGVPVKDTMEKYQIDPDKGMYKTTNNAFTKFSFKTPTVRNAALTAPYMHNGVYKTLEQVVNFYDHAGGAKFRSQMQSQMEEVPFFTLIPIELKLTEIEKKELISFLKALTDTSASHTPSRLPEIKGKFAHLNKRKIGGEY